jgi:signal transduction histidine kinase/ActR/RegA family two-component response regulator
MARRNRWLQLLSETVADLLSATDQPQMMQAVFDKVSDYMSCDIFLNHAVAKDSASLLLEAAGGINEAMQESFARLEFGETICGAAAHMRKAITVDNIQESGNPQLEKWRALGARCIICQPLLADDHLLGTLSYASRTKDRFDADEKEFIAMVGHYVALAKMRMNAELGTRHAEERLRTALEETARQAKAAGIAKSEFLANMSHEIRTSMNAIIGLTHLLDQAGISEEKRQDAFRIMKCSAQQLMELINNILDISKIESKQVELECIPFDLDVLLEEIVSIQNVNAAEKNIALAINYLCKPEAQVIGDPARIKQVIMNLVGNAVKFTEKGEVNLVVDCPSARDGKTACLHMDIQDTGIGIKPEHVQGIFTKFSQGDASMTRKYGGTGLGLAISKNLIETMGGDITVTSTYGQGACFSVSLSLPFYKEDKVVYPHFGSVSARSDLRGVRILLVEDYAANIMVAATLLEQLGCAYTVAHDGKEALSRLKEESFDIVLMDVQMPVMDGFKTTALIRALEKEHAKPHTVVIGITARVLTGDRELCLESGMDDYLSKPFNPDEFEEKIAKHVAKSVKALKEA